MNHPHTRLLYLLLVLPMLTGCIEHVQPGPGAPPPVQNKESQEHRYVSVDRLNLRACPGTECRIVRVLRQGQRGVVVQQESGWSEFSPENDAETGWVASRYLSLQPQPLATPSRISRNRAEPEPLEPMLPAEEFSPPASIAAEPRPAVSSRVSSTAAGEIIAEEYAR